LVDDDDVVEVEVEDEVVSALFSADLSAGLSAGLLEDFSDSSAFLRDSEG
jgi:hypothetical protein